MANTIISSSTKHSINDTPLQETERKVIYDLLMDLRDGALRDPEVPPLNELFAAVEFTAHADGETLVVEGALLERRRMSECLSPEVVEMVKSLPVEEDTWLLVVYHPQGVGVFNVRVPGVSASAATEPQAASVKPTNDQLHEQLGEHLQLSRVQTGRILQEVERLCALRLEIPNAPPVHEMVAIIHVENSGQLHGALADHGELVKVTSAQVQKALLETPGKSPGKMLVMLIAESGKGGVFSVIVEDLPSINAKGARGVMN
jgi:hypothetical protein